MDDSSDLQPLSEGEYQVSMFKNKEVRKVFHAGEWYFSVVDVIDAITETTNSRRYWSDLKRKLVDEGGDQLYEEIVQLKMPGSDGKEYATDAASTETMFRIIQSVPSPKAEVVKRWLARVGYERVVEIQNPEIGLKRMMAAYQLQGRDDDWIDARIRTIITRKELTGEWARRGVQPGLEFAKLTNVISQETFDVPTQDHRALKGLPKSADLRDHMTDLELILTMLGEKSTTNIARVRDAHGYTQNERAAHDGGKVAGEARKNLERQLGEKIVSPANFLPKDADQSRLD